MSDLFGDPPLTFDANDSRLVKANQLDSFVRWAKGQKVRVLDYETTGLRAWKGDRVFAAGIYAPDKGAKVVDLRFLKDVREHAERAIADAVAGSEGTTIGHNLAFECSHSEGSFGVEIGGRLWDNQAAAYACVPPKERESNDPEFGPLTQKSLVKKFVPGRTTPYAVAVHNWLKQRFGSDETKWRFDLIPGTLIVPYLCEDLEDAYGLALYLRERAEKQGQLDLVRTDSELCRCISEIEMTGVQLDRPYAEKLLAKNQAEMNDAYKRFRAAAGRDADLGSHQVLFGIFYGTFGLPLHKDVEKAGHLDKDVLGWFKTLDAVKQDPKKLAAVEAVEDFRAAQINVSTFLMPWLYEHSHKDVLHFALNPYGAETRRFSSAKPNGQNIPTRSELGSEIRGCIAARDGHTNYSLDESQAEYRFFAHYSAEPSLVDGYTNDPDFDIHVLVSALLELERKDGKNMNFGLLYGMGVEKLARKLRVSKEKAKALVDAYYARLKKVAGLKSDIEKQIRNFGYLKTVFGGRRWLTRNDAYKGLNTLMQMSVADLMRKAMVRARPIIRKAGGRMLHQIHDEIKFQLPGREKEFGDHMPVVREVRREMMNFRLRIPLRADCERYTTRWNEATEVLILEN